MEHYAGVDVSLESSCVWVVDGTGRVLRETKLTSEPEALITWFRGRGIELARIGLEAGPLSQWLYAGLRDAGLAVALLETRLWRSPMPRRSTIRRGFDHRRRLGAFRTDTKEVSVRRDGRDRPNLEDRRCRCAHSAVRGCERHPHQTCESLLTEELGDARGAASGDAQSEGRAGAQIGGGPAPHVGGWHDVHRGKSCRRRLGEEERPPVRAPSTQPSGARSRRRDDGSGQAASAQRTSGPSARHETAVPS